MAPKPRQGPPILFVILCAAAVAAFLVVGRWRSGPKLRMLCVASAVPQSPQAVGRNWYWLEKGAADTALVGVTGERRILARASELPSFWASAMGLAWIARDGGRYRVMVAGPGRASERELYHSSDTLAGVWTDGVRTAWLAKKPVPKSPARFIPPLGAVTEVWWHDGVSAARSASLAEGFATAQVVGVREGAIYVTGMRNEGIRVSVVYRVRPGGPAERIVGEDGAISVLLEDHTLYWTALSRESNYRLTGCVRGMDLRTGTVRTVAEWLPGGGALCRTAAGLAICAGLTETSWLLDQRRKLGERIACPGDQWAISASGDRLLAVRRRKTPGRVVVSEVLAL